MIPHNMTLFKFICVQYQFHGQTLPIMKIDRGQIQFREYVSTGTEPYSEECMCRLQYIAMLDYQECVTDGQTTDKEIPMCLNALQATHKMILWCKQEAQRVTYCASEYNMPPFGGIGKGGHFLFTDPPEKYTLGRGCWYLAFCQVSLNTFQRF